MGREEIIDGTNTAKYDTHVSRWDRLLHSSREENDDAVLVSALSASFIYMPVANWLPR
jgi:hypothetical protein